MAHAPFQLRCGEAQHDDRHGLIEALLWEIAARALALGVNVILDFGFWAKVEREDYRARAQQLGAGSQIHFLDVPEAKFKEALAIFQPPGPDELERSE